MRLRGQDAPSRVLFGPIETNLGDGRAFSERHTAFYRRRAEGGAGVIVTEIASVHDSDRPYERAPLASLSGPGWARIVAACRPHGALVLAGLGHAGGQGDPALFPDTGRTPLWGPSPVPDVVSREVPYALAQPEFDALVTGFADAAGLAVAQGCHGVELNAGQHSILRQFLSGLTNHRTDRYGGLNRGRLLREVVTRVRAELGERVLLGLRLCVEEMAPEQGGITPAQIRPLLAELAVQLDYVVPVRGSALSVPATRPDLHTPPGFNRELCAGIRAGLATSGSGLAVVLQGSVVDVAMADEALDAEPPVADLVEMTRAQLAAPDLVALARAGYPDRIRPCTLSNQHSQVRGPANLVISDEGEPATGHESEDAAVPVEAGMSLGLLPPASGAEVLVVGGGPAGLEAARVAALLGHRVRLVEQSPWLGGALRGAAVVRGRGRLGRLTDWLVSEVYRLGVIVRTESRIAVDTLDQAAHDRATVLLCTGSRPARPGFTVGPGVVVRPAAEFESDVLASASVADALSSLTASSPAGAGLEVVVHDPVGDWTGVGVAEQVAASGVRCTLVTPDPVAGAQLARTGDLAEANGRLQRAGVRREVYATLLGARRGRAELVDVHTEERRSVPCTLVIDCAPRLAQDELWLARPDVPRAGDCVAPRTVYEAILEGRRAALGVLPPVEVAASA